MNNKTLKLMTLQATESFIDTLRACNIKVTYAREGLIFEHEEANGRFLIPKEEIENACIN